MSTKVRPKATLSWSLDVECPNCQHDFDLVPVDANNDYVIAKYVFNNDWDSVDGCDVTCPECEHEFQLAGIEY